MLACAARRGLRALESDEVGGRVSTVCVFLFLDRGGAEPYLQILAKCT